MGVSKEKRKEEIRALQAGIDLGMTVIDTAEMYGEGAAEVLVGEAVRGRRERTFLVSKAYPQNASRTRLAQACDQSLRRLGVDQLDLYLLHWRGNVSLDEVSEAFEKLQSNGKIASWGVSNLDVDELDELKKASFVTDQVLYNPEHRGIEFDLLPWCRKQQIPVMAYSPVGQGGDLLQSGALRKIAQRHSATPAQVAIAWGLRQAGVLSIPKSGSEAHVQENARALDLVLTDEDLAEIDGAFPPPRRKQSLSML